ncbi:hypothetical protein IWW48_004420 [Coemansia sp. RSA 1200]|nr:hypothetical protein IWW48_004420 [Coemansia sp. RSA 1200]
MSSEKEEERLKRQIQELEAAITKHKDTGNSTTAQPLLRYSRHAGNNNYNSRGRGSSYSRYSPIRPLSAGGSPRPPHSRSMKLVVKGDGQTPEKYLSTRNTLTKVGVAPESGANRSNNSGNNTNGSQNARYTGNTVGPRRRIVVDGEEYVFTGKGNNKLVRASSINTNTDISAGSIANPVETPPQRYQQTQTHVLGKTNRGVSIDGVDYVRTKRGSLVRVGALQLLSKRATRTSKTGQRRKRPATRTRICTKYMIGKCEKSEDECKYSHNPTPETAPVCVHFQRGACADPEDCLFVHVAVNPNAPICRDFVYKGFCAKGARCLHRHVWECPDWVEKGKCTTRRRCRLPHPPATTSKSQDKAPLHDGPNGVEDERALQRPVFGKQPGNESDYLSESSGSDEDGEDSLDQDVSDDEAEELLKWYDDNHIEST